MMQAGLAKSWQFLFDWLTYLWSSSAHHSSTAQHSTEHVFEAHYAHATAKIIPTPPRYLEDDMQTITIAALGQRKTKRRKALSIEQRSKQTRL